MDPPFPRLVVDRQERITPRRTLVVDDKMAHQHVVATAILTTIRATTNSAPRMLVNAAKLRPFRSLRVSCSFWLHRRTAFSHHNTATNRSTKITTRTERQRTTIKTQSKTQTEQNNPIVGNPRGNPTQKCTHNTNVYTQRKLNNN